MLGGSRLVAVLAAAGTLAALGSVTAPARAADACPNAEIRAEQHATRLPECRAYELVSPADKGGNGIISANGLVAPSGDAVSFFAGGAYAGALSNDAVPYIARRAADGWRTTALAPPMDGVRLPRLKDMPELVGASRDLTRAVVSTSFPVDPLDQGDQNAALTRSSDDLFLFGAGGSIAWISPSATLPDTSGNPVSYVAGSTDLDRILMSSKRMLAPGVPDETVLQYYLRTEGQPTTLVSAAPDGTPLPTAVSEIRMSADGSRIVFTDGAPGARRLYMRVNGADATQTKTVVPTFGPDDRACENATLDALSADGDRLLFRCSTSLTDVSHTDAEGYLADLDTGAVRYVGYTGEVVATTPDLERGFIFQSPEVLILHDGDLTAAAPTSLGLGFHTASISPDGKYLAFAASAHFGFPAEGLRQVYRVSAATGRVECISCPSDGSPAEGESSLWRFLDGIAPAMPGAVADDGRVFFSSEDALVSRDVNGKEDVYEWIDGHVHLISSGTGSSDSWFVRATSDGGSIFFVTASSLVAQDVDNGVRDVYVARVDGGFAAPVVPAPCTSGCQGPPTSGPAAARPGSLAFTGAGNVAFVPRAERARLAVARPRVARRRAVRLRVRVSSRGRIVVSGPRVRRVRRTVRRAGSSRVVVQLRRRALRRLRARGAIRARVRVTFRPANGGRAVSKVVRVRFKHSKRARMHKHSKRAARHARHAAMVARLHTNGKGGR